MRKRILRGVLLFLAVAVVGAALVIPYYRQLLFGPTYQGVPLCVWQDQIRRQTLGEKEHAWLVKVRKWFQPKDESLASVKLTREERIAIWLTFLDDPVPALRTQAIQVLWGRLGPGWGSGYVTFLGGDVSLVRLASVDYLGTMGYSEIVWDGTWCSLNLPQGMIQPAPPVKPHLLRMLDDDNAEVRQAAFTALSQQGNEAAPAFPRLFELLEHADATRRAQAARTLNATHPKTRSWLERLITMLDDPSADVRNAVTDCLAAWTDRRMAVAAGPRLVLALRDPDHTVRIQAAWTLGALSVHTHQATEALRAGMRDADPSMRNRALSALFVPAGAALFPEIVQRARSDPDQNVRTAAINALWHGGEQAVPVLVSFLRHANADVRSAALQSLHNLGPKARLAVPHLLADLESFAGNGVQALAAIGDVNAVPKLVELLAHRELRAPALSALQSFGADAGAALPKILEMLDDQAELRQQALLALLTIGGDQEEILQALEKRLLTELASKRDDLVWNFCQQRDKASALVPALIKRLETDDAKSGVAHVQALGAIGPAARAAAPALLLSAKESNDDLRGAVIAALGDIAADERRCVPWLIEQLERDEQVIRAANALAQFGGRARSALPHLAPLLKSARADYRAAAIWALAAIGPPEDATSLLVPLLRDRDEEIRRNATQALCSLGVREEVKHFVALLRDEPSSIRNAVARALGELGPSAADAVPALCALLDDDSQTTFEYALEALSRIEP